MPVTAAINRGDIANYVQALFDVYIALLLIYLLANMALSMGLRPPYSRTFDAVMSFLRELSEPLLRPFRRVIPQIGMFDFSPLVVLILLYVVDFLVVGAIRG
jgi:YggT family protein